MTSTTFVTYDCVASLLGDNSLVAGQIVQTLGYTPGGPGGNQYQIQQQDSASPATPDNGSLLTLGHNNLQARGLFPAGVVDVCQFGALPGQDSSTAFQQAMACARTVQITASTTPYLLSGDIIASRCRRLFSQGASLTFTATDKARGLVFDGCDGLSIQGLRFTTTGTVDQFIHARNGTDITLSDNHFDHAGCTAALQEVDPDTGYIRSGGVCLEGVNRVLISRNRFENGWRDHSYDAANVGGNNLMRALYINNAGQTDIRIRDNRFTNVWAGVYAKNSNSLYVTANQFSATADTAIFDRCTGGVSRNKRFLNNQFYNIGKSAIKPLDSNNDNDLVWGENALVDGNRIENWGVNIVSAGILSGRNYVRQGPAQGYQYSPIKSRNLMITNNTLVQSVQCKTGRAFNIINTRGVLIDNNSVRPKDDLAADNVLAHYCRDVRVSHNEFVYQGGLQLSYAHEGAYQFHHNQARAATAVQLYKEQPGISQQLLFADNQFSHTGTVSRVYGLDITRISQRFTLVCTGNQVTTPIPAHDWHGSGSRNLIGLPYAQPQIIDNNLITFTDAHYSQKMLAGELANPLHNRGLPGAAALVNNAIQCKTTTARSGDLITLSYQ